MDGGGGKMAAAISMESLNSVSTESCSQVRTLFVSGLPMDAKPRELYLLFRAYRGYESSLLKMTAKNGKPTSPVGFVTFQTSRDADDARKALQGVRFDPDCAQVLRLELAKSNTKVSRPKQSPPPVIPIATPSLQAMPQFLAPLQPTDTIVLDQHPLLLDQHQLFSLTLPRFPASAAAHSLPLAGILPSDGNYHQNAAIFQAALGLGTAAAQNAAALQGCSTLFVANLSPGVTEDELRSVFKAFAGFTRLRMHTKKRLVRRVHRVLVTGIGDKCDDGTAGIPPRIVRTRWPTDRVRPKQNGRRERLSCLILYRLVFISL
ncbi:hypothetical protein KIN20_020124 [Parelaphostrongylus tenuis]|uniref:RRM domain-containing protein n=1 Tax=Parelaphostrongylus tenuis TaxID=148309 RepID=A0AAD5N3R5_PARTN|nr:hypothetical protein KIN20_020124 [Parelaphostrongylus tenuis]